jgi:hypothetical protein
MRKFLGIALTFLLAAGGVLLAMPRPALAHCDNINGPVVGAAKQALAAGEVKLVLPYVQAESEAELTAAFDQAMAVRKLGGQAAALADRYFFETAVRLHRQGEGAAYTGLKFEDDYGPALHAAEEALQNGSLAEVTKILTDETAKGLEQRYHAVVEARAAALREGTVAADRERAEAELQFELYVHGLYLAATGQSEHEGAAAPQLFFGTAELKAPVLAEHGTVWLPLRALVEAAGGTVTWDQASGAAIARVGAKGLSVKPGEAEVRLADGVTFVPSRLLADAFGWSITDDGGIIRVTMSAR